MDGVIVRVFVFVYGFVFVLVCGIVFAFVIVCVCTCLYMYLHESAFIYLIPLISNFLYHGNIRNILSSRGER